ncbi:hypothetical protein C8F01DRAFT_1248029 [Mycena amicta]|nr:hypothetical protein C8F01DRAFT_1248029 [Mycena amicta]
MTPLPAVSPASTSSSHSLLPSFASGAKSRAYLENYLQPPKGAIPAVPPQHTTGPRLSECEWAAWKHRQVTLLEHIRRRLLTFPSFAVRSPVNRFETPQYSLLAAVLNRSMFCAVVVEYEPAPQIPSNPTCAALNHLRRWSQSQLYRPVNIAVDVGVVSVVTTQVPPSSASTSALDVPSQSRLPCTLSVVAVGRYAKRKRDQFGWHCALMWAVNQNEREVERHWNFSCLLQSFFVWINNTPVVITPRLGFRRPGPGYHPIPLPDPTPVGVPVCVGIAPLSIHSAVLVLSDS